MDLNLRGRSALHADARDRRGRTPLDGVAAALIAYSFFSVSDASVKLVGGRIDPFEVAFFGSLCAIPLLPFVKAPGDRFSDVLRTTGRPVWLLRTVAVAISVVASVVAFTRLSMPEAFSIIFLMPTFVTLLSVGLLKEKVGLARWASVVVGFVGVLVVLRPGFRTLDLGHFAALLVGLTAAVGVVASRLAGEGEKRISLFGATIVGPLVANGILMIPGFRVPGVADVAYIVGYGALAALGQLFIMLATRRSPASRLASSQYIQMLWGVGLGFLLFREPVGPATLVGVLIILGAGLIPWAHGKVGARLRDPRPAPTPRRLPQRARIHLASRDEAEAPPLASSLVAPGPVAPGPVARGPVTRESGRPPSA